MEHHGAPPVRFVGPNEGFASVGGAPRRHCALPPFGHSAPICPVGGAEAATPTPQPYAQTDDMLWKRGAKGVIFWRYFGRSRSIWLEAAEPMRQKAIQGLLSRFRWSPTTSIFDGFFADLNRALSALFSNFGSQKSENPGHPPPVGGVGQAGKSDPMDQT